MNDLDVLIRDAAQIYVGGGETLPLGTSIGIAGERIVFIRTLIQGKQGGSPGRSIDNVANTGQYL